MSTYIVRKQINSDTPEEEGPELRRFRTWQEAKEYGELLYKEDQIKTYISIRR